MLVRADTPDGQTFELARRDWTRDAGHAVSLIHAIRQLPRLDSRREVP